MSVTEAAEEESGVLIMVCAAALYLLTQLCKVARLLPRSVAIVVNEAPEEFSR